MPNARINPDAFYVNGTVIPATYFQQLDTAQFQAINGDHGGTWSPAVPIAIDGAGMWATGPWTSSSAPAIASANAGDASRITHGDSDWIGLGSGHAGSARTLDTSLGGAADTSYWTPGTGNGLPTVTYLSTSHGAVVGPTGSFVGGARLTMPIRVHHGALLTEVAFYYKVADPHSGGLPGSFPLMRVLQVDLAGNATPLATDPTALNGWLPMSAATTTAGYYRSGAIGNIAYLTQTVIDTSRYSYVAQVVDESGANAKGGNTFTQVIAFLQSITDLRPQ